MNKEKLKLIVKNLKLLVDSLESEVNSDTEDTDDYKYETYQQISSPIDDDYDEVFDDED